MNRRVVESPYTPSPSLIDNMIVNTYEISTGGVKNLTSSYNTNLTDTLNISTFIDVIPKSTLLPNFILNDYTLSKVG